MTVAQSSRSRGTFELLWSWLNGEVLYESPAETLSEQHRLALTHSVRRSRYGFALVVERNWRKEEQTREVHLSGVALRDFWRLEEWQAVDRILGHDDGNRWVPGIAGLEPAEARVLRFAVCECWGMQAMKDHLRMTSPAIWKAKSEGKRKLREFFRLPKQAKEREMPITAEVEED